eukprot:CAMPEP_0172917664 /NCGR_PEP_ID=MMETSP1075-20121228/198764_1 /TAXON_ID=2916 /ORGANISM="Ceratium fusus, Strain PA161109" /LENGTH=162 /DNA_ID=CAMNT_0013777175 /DNA_START=121 /DNA_END=610 /DNA_ORIENTATION=+
MCGPNAAASGGGNVDAEVSNSSVLDICVNTNGTACGNGEVDIGFSDLDVVDSFPKSQRMAGGKLIVVVASSELPGSGVVFSTDGAAASACAFAAPGAVAAGADAAGPCTAASATAAASAVATAAEDAGFKSSQIPIVDSREPASDLADSSQGYIALARWQCH